MSLLYFIKQQSLDFFCKLYKLKVLRCFIILSTGETPWALIADNAEERFNYRNKEGADRGGDDEKLEERFRARDDGKILVVVTRIQFIKRASKA